jgi:hypothetical protein
MLDEAEGDSDGLALCHCLAQMLDEAEGSWKDLHWAITCTLLDEAEGAHDGHALGPLLCTMFDETEAAMDGLSTGAITWHHAG